MAFIFIFFSFLKKFEKVEKTGIISVKFSLRCTPFVILGCSLFWPKRKYIPKFLNIFFALKLHNFSVPMLKYYLKFLRLFFSSQQFEKATPKNCILMAAGRFFSLQPRLPKIAQNFISVLKILLLIVQPSCVGSLIRIK